mmetsp:Transcript_15097/g.14496  ORF Transcript_15097/g.14496 Transcript_15097/m.14496 type:complete len:1181 (+) Transcript_15097:105-3647(+)
MFKALKKFANPSPKKKEEKEIRRITLGICAMDKKARSKPMREILNRLPEQLFDITVFGDDLILNKPVEEWPVVEVLIAFYSTNYPLAKALEYVKLRNPFMINDLTMDATLKDRRKVYQLLQGQGINVPFHVILDRESGVDNVVEEFDEYIIVNGVTINKPFVEKPVDAENHNIYIYYPMSVGGGSKRLFRKIDNKSSDFYPTVNEVRTEGSFIYEEFVHTQGTDVKVYTVGPDYGHAEARKSPVVDGRVNRDSVGLEVRYPVILTPIEKEIAYKVVMTFKQTVCGFDIMRAKGVSYCCDVNGFSFVKNSRKYYDDASQVLTEIMMAAVRKEMFDQRLSTRAPLTQPITKDRLAMLGIRTPKPVGVYNESQSERPPSPSLSVCSELGEPKKNEELRCVIAVLRHGDRTPKQKMKFKVTELRYLDYFHAFAKGPYKDLKVKSKSALVKFLEITREVIKEGGIPGSLVRQLKQIRDVLERWEISGFNRKLQMKPQKWSNEDIPIDEVEAAEGREDRGSAFSSPRASPDVSPVRATEVLVILKWGGDLTPLGRQQAELLGTKFRHAMYPDPASGGGVLRLHATYRHDLKIKASDEGRVMKTAAAFTKGLLELEGNLTPILSSLVTVEEKDRKMLDKGGNDEIKGDMDRCKEHMANLLQSDQLMTEEYAQKVAPNSCKALKAALMSLKNPLHTLKRMAELIDLLVAQLDVLCRRNETNNGPDPVVPLDYSKTASETWVSSTPTPIKSSKSAMNTSAPAVTASLEVDTASSEASDILFRSTSSTSSTSPPLTGTPSQPSATDKIDIKDAFQIDIPIDIELLSSDCAACQPIPLEEEEQKKDHSQDTLYLSETFSLMSDRWEKLRKDFFSPKTQKFDLTKVPDIYDMIRFDVLHNSHLELDGLHELFELSSAFENSVVPQEYGTDRDDKRRIGSKMCKQLLEKIKYDLTITMSEAGGHSSDLGYHLDHSHAEDIGINSLGRCVRTRLYFTSESHLHTLLNVMRFPREGDPCALSNEGLELLDSVKELSYLTQVVIRLFEDSQQAGRLRCELSFSPGANICPYKDNACEVAPYITINKSIRCDQMLKCLDNAITAGDEEEGNGETEEKEAISPEMSQEEEVRKGINTLPVPMRPRTRMSAGGGRHRHMETVVSSSDMDASDTWETEYTENGAKMKKDMKEKHKSSSSI